MSASVKIMIIGQPREALLSEIARIKEWDNGKDYPIIVNAGPGRERYDSLGNIESAIKGDLAEYLEKNFGSKKMILKSGGHDDLFFIPNPELYDENNHFRKNRSVATNFTPKKKKRKKNK